MDKLLFSIDKEIANPLSKAGKVWRIFIKNGTLHVGDSIKITSVNLLGQSKADFFDIEAVIKSIREELDAFEEIKETNNASKSRIVGIDIKNCYCNKKKIKKREIKITKQSIGFASHEQFGYCGEFYIKFVDAEKAFDIVKVGQNIMLLWFGKSISAKVIEIQNSIEGMYINMLYDKKLAIPENPILRNIIKNIIILAEHEGKSRYFSGLFEFDNK